MQKYLLSFAKIFKEEDKLQYLQDGQLLQAGDEGLQIRMTRRRGQGEVTFTFNMPPLNN